MCQQHATYLRVEGEVVQFLCMHLFVVSEREISDVVLFEFCITMTKSGAGPNGCVRDIFVCGVSIFLNVATRHTNLFRHQSGTG